MNIAYKKLGPRILWQLNNISFVPYECIGYKKVEEYFENFDQGKSIKNHGINTRGPQQVGYAQVRTLKNLTLHEEEEEWQQNIYILRTI